MFIRLTVTLLMLTIFHQIIGMKTGDDFQRNTCPGKCILPEDTKDCTNELRHSAIGVSEVCQRFFKRKFASEKECRKKCYGCGAHRMLAKCSKGGNGVTKGGFVACFKRPDGGLCKAYFVMWYYNVKQRKCKTFVYGGCGGNDNKFETQLECLETCGILAFPDEAKNRKEL